MQKDSKGTWGFDSNGIDTAVRPQDDFYRYANGNWMKKATIPPEESRWGSFSTLRVETEHKLKHIMDDLLRRRSHKRGSPEQLVSDYYRSAIDMKRRNALGIRPLHDLRLAVEKISSQDDLLKALARLHKAGVSGVWNFFVDQDSKDSTRYMLHLWQGGLGMPERDYYLLDKPEQKRVRDAYIAHIEKLLGIAGFARQNIRPAREVVMKIESRLARASMKKEDTRDPEKVYHKVAPSQFWKNYFALMGATAVTHVIVGQPKFFAEAQRMLQDIPLSEWKTYLKWHLINDFAGSLSEPFVKEHFDFYSRVLRGTKKMKPLWRRALMSADSALGEPFGKLYVQKYFPESAKRAVDALVNDLFEVYEERMQKLDWMSPATKRKAVQKLHAMTRKIGYPKKWDLYKGVVIRPDDYLGNMMRVHAHDFAKMMRKLRRGVDRNEWFMSPQTVNAYHAPNLNDIAFPAGILQWPFFDPQADDALNYAGIGYTIGHEMTHGFDDSGAKFDQKGNMRGWWSAGDKKRFEKKGKGLVRQFNAYTVAKGVRINGQLTLGENIADLGGLAIAFDAYQKHLKKTGRKAVGGLSPEMRFFLAFAQQEREVARDEFKKFMAAIDPHSPGFLRVNVPLSNFKPFYETFGVKKGDKLYRSPASRAEIW